MKRSSVVNFCLNFRVITAIVLASEDLGKLQYNVL